METLLILVLVSPSPALYFEELIRIRHRHLPLRYTNRSSRDKEGGFLSRYSYARVLGCAERYSCTFFLLIMFPPHYCQLEDANRGIMLSGTPMVNFVGVVFGYDFYPV